MSATIRENMLVTMGMYAGELAQQRVIKLPSGNDGEDMLADFCVECVDRWMAPDGLVDENGDCPDISFEEYAGRCLMESFGRQKDDAPIEEEGQYEVIAVAGSVEKDLGIRGTHDECERWCDYYDWVYQPDGPDGFVWDLYIEEV